MPLRAACVPDLHIIWGKPPVTGGFYAFGGSKNRFLLLDIPKALC
jgi:hypothetical protein